MLAEPRLASVAVRAGVYTRISSDPSGQRAGVERQRAECEEYCLTRGWQVAELFEDNEYSASNGRRRPAYGADARRHRGPPGRRHRDMA